MSKAVTAVREDRKTVYLQHGKVVPKNATVAQALKAGGLDWTVELEDVSVRGKVLTHRRAAVRQDNGTVFDVVGTGYKPISNAEAFGIGDDLRAIGGAQFIACGETAGGRTAWMAFEVPDASFKVGGTDEYHLEGLIETSHDGKRAVRVHVTPIRLQCTNQMNLMVRKAVQRWSIHHTSKAPERLAEAHVSVGLIGEYVKAFQETTEALLKQTVSDKQLETFLTRLIPARPRKAQEIEAITDLARTADTNEFGRGTAYAALNAVREYYDHVRPTRTTESAFIGAVNGVNARMTNRALQLLEARASGRAMA
jgi:phage/plasmid-like protein (TIGR03299 family)